MKQGYQTAPVTNWIPAGSGCVTRTEISVDIETPSVTAAIRGTELNIEVAEDLSARITVLSGRVGCRNESGSLVAGKKDVIDTIPGMASSRQTVLSTDYAVQWTVTVPVTAISAGIPATDRQTPVDDDVDDENPVNL